MKLTGALLDAGTLGDGVDLSPLAEVLVLKSWAYTDPGDVVARLQGCQVALTNKVVLNEAVLEALPELKYIGVLATGEDSLAT